MVQEHPLPEDDDEVAGAPGDCTDEVPGPSCGQDLDAQVPSSKGGHGLELLWHWSQGAVQEHSVTCMAWNQVSHITHKFMNDGNIRGITVKAVLVLGQHRFPGCCSRVEGQLASFGSEQVDSLGKLLMHVLCMQAAPCVLAVGHGCKDVRLQGDGHLTLWSLKDSLRPVNSISTPAGITSIAWSKRTPNHIAVGLHSGIIAIYGAMQKQASAPHSNVHLDISAQ